MDNNIDIEHNPTVEEETKAAEETAENAVQPPETVEVKLLRYKNGMENWHGEVQMLFCPQFENGRNVLPLYSKDVLFTITITDRYDKVKIIKLHPSSIFGEGVARGTAIIRFQPCVEEGDNFWVPEGGQSYWMAFSALGTDGKLYISNEREMFLQSQPILHGRWLSTGDAVPPQMGGFQSASNASDAAIQSRIDELEERIDDLESSIDDVSGDIEDVLEEKIEELKGDLQKRIDQAFYKLQRGKAARIEPKAEEPTLSSVLEKIERLEERFSEQIKEAMSSIAPLDGEEYYETIDNIIGNLTYQHEKTLAVYRTLAERLTESTFKSPQERYIEEQTAYIKTLPDDQQRKMFAVLWALALKRDDKDKEEDEEDYDDEDDEDEYDEDDEDEDDEYEDDEDEDDEDEDED